MFRVFIWEVCGLKGGWDSNRLTEDFYRLLSALQTNTVITIYIILSPSSILIRCNSSIRPILSVRFTANNHMGYFRCVFLYETSYSPFFLPQVTTAFSTVPAVCFAARAVVYLSSVDRNIASSCLKFPTYGLCEGRGLERYGIPLCPHFHEQEVS